MIKVKCISKNRNEKGVIINYTLQDQNGQKKEFTAKEIKQGIVNKKLEVTNLQIDKAGRLIDKAETKKNVINEELNRAIHELGQQMLNGKNAQCRTEYVKNNEDCKITFYDVKVDPVLIKFLQEKRGMGEEYILRELVRQFKREVYTINGIHAMNFDKKKLYYGLKYEYTDGLIYHCYYYTVENLKQAEETKEMFMQRNYMDYNYGQEINSRREIISHRIVYREDQEDVAKHVEERKAEFKNHSNMTPKEIVKDFLSRLDERYGDDWVGDRFTADYNGTWQCGEEPMPPEVKKYFKTLIDCLEKHMRESSVYIYDPYEANVTDEEFLRNSKLPEKVVKFMQTTKCNKGIVKGLVSLAAESEGIAQISVIMANILDDGTEPITYTANYNEAKKHFKASIDEWRDWTKDTLDLDREATLEEVVNQIEVEGNDLAQKWFIKYIAEVDNKQLDYYKEKVIALIKTHADNNPKSEIGSIIRTALWDMEALPYMILKYDVYRTSYDDYNNEYKVAIQKEVTALIPELRERVARGEF